MSDEERRICPLTTQQLVDVVMAFVEVYNKSAGIELYTYQQMFIRRVILSLLLRDGEAITGLWSRQAGKSEAISSLAGSLCVILPALAKNYPDDDRLGQYGEGVWIGIFAPRLQQSGIIYERVRKRAEKQESAVLYADPDIQIHLTQSRGDLVSWSNNAFVSSQTASEQTNVEGRTYHLVIIDEAQLISRQKVAKEIMPMLAATMGSCVKIGTVSEFKGGFHDSINLNLDREKRTGDRTHFEFDYETVIAEKRKKFEETQNSFHLNYEKWVEKELERLGGNKENEEFRMNFRLLWPMNSRMLFDSDTMIAAGDATASLGVVRYKRRCVAGIDLAKSRDCTVLTVNEVGDEVLYNLPIDDRRAANMAPDGERKKWLAKTFVGWFEAYGRWTEQVAQCLEHLRLFNVDVLCVDATGVGDPICEMFEDALPGVLVVPIVFSAQSKDRIYKYYQQELEAGRQMYAADEEALGNQALHTFLHEHQTIEKRYSGIYMCPSAPSGGHDDYCSSAALACWAAQFAGNGEEGGMEVGRNLFYSPQPPARGILPRARAERYR